MKISIIILVFFSILLSDSQAQSKKVREKFFDDAEYFFKREEYQEALYQYKMAMGKDSLNALLNYKIGETYLQIPGQETMAIPYLELASESIEFDVKFNNFEEQHAPLHTLFYLGNAYRLANEPQKALEVYARFTDHPDYYDNYNLEIVETEIAAVERAKIIKDRPVNYQFINLGAPVNTKAKESYPVISGNGNVLVFVRELAFYSALFFTTKTDQGWSEPVNITPEVGSDGDAYPTALSFDGSELYLISSREGNANIYRSKFNNGKWDIMKTISDNINSRKNETSACISADGKVLYFSSDKKSRNGYDIYQSNLVENEWSEPESISEIINSDMDETDPYITADGNTLYFSSNGHYNMGKKDIFIAEKDNSGWKLPKNAGYPLNTTNNNENFVPLSGGEGGYISRFTEAQSENEDIYFVKFP